MSQLIRPGHDSNAGVWNAPAQSGRPFDPSSRMAPTDLQTVYPDTGARNVVVLLVITITWLQRCPHHVRKSRPAEARQPPKCLPLHSESVKGASR